MPSATAAYLFASSDGRTTDSDSVFHRAATVPLAEALCDMFAKEYGANGRERQRSQFHYRRVAEVGVSDQVLLDEALDFLSVFSDPDPSVYDPSPTSAVMDKAQMGQRAVRWEAMLAERSGAPTAVSTAVDDRDVAEALDIGLSTLVHALDRHRLTFLFFAQAKRPRTVGATGQVGLPDRVKRDDVRGWSDMVRDIDAQGRFLFTYRRVLDAFAEEAISTFGPGDGMPADTDKTARPYWIIDDGGPSYLEHTSNAILEACRDVAALDSAGQLADAIRATMTLAHPTNQSRWYSCVGVAWGYLSELDDLMVLLKRQRVEVRLHQADRRGQNGKADSPRTEDVGSGWVFSGIDDGRVRAVNAALCREYATLDGHDLLLLSTRWRGMVVQFTAATKRAGCYHGFVVHDEQVLTVTRLLETAASARKVSGVDRLGRCLRRPDDNHLHWALALLDQLDAAVRAETVTTDAKRKADVPEDVQAFLSDLGELTERERKHLLGFYLFMCAQAYYNLVEAVAGSDVGWVDVELNNWYIQITEAINKLLTSPELSDFEGGFSAILDNLFPSFELNAGWDDCFGPPVVEFLGRAQAYSVAHPLGQSDKTLLLAELGEIVRGKCQQASEVASRYAQRARAEMNRLLDAAGPGPSTSTTGRPSDSAPESQKGGTPSRSSPMAAGPVPAVVLRGKGESCTVAGKSKPPLSDAEHAVVSALIEAKEDGLSKDGLESARPSARRILRDLSRDPDWSGVILLPGRTNVRYRLRSLVEPVSTSDHL